MEGDRWDRRRGLEPRAFGGGYGGKWVAQWGLVHPKWGYVACVVPCFEAASAHRGQLQGLYPSQAV